MANCPTSKSNLRLIRAANPCAAAAQFARSDDAFLRGNPFFLAANESAAAAVRRELAAADGILPPTATLPQLAAAAETGIPPENLPAAARLIEPDFAAAHRRLVMEIYGLLRENGGRENIFRLPEAESMAAVMEEFIAEYPELVPPLSALPELCKKMEGYNLETELLSALWNFLHEGALLSPRRALADFARTAPPLIYAGEQPRLRWEDDFLQQCAGGAVVFEPETAAPDNILNGDSFPAPKECRQGFSDSLDGAAKLALAAVCGFAAGGGTVGIAVYDRLLARRLRAIAETARIYIEDDGGWRMETLSFGGALRQWAETAMNHFSAAAFGGLLFAPYWAEDSRRPAAAHAWRKIMSGGGGLPEKWEDLHRFSESEFYPFAEMLLAARREMPKNAPPAEWVRWLLLHSSAPLAAWKEDAVAARLRAALCKDTEGGGGWTAADFSEWLGLFMRTETSGARDVKSRVCFVSPKTSRRFDGLLLLGAHAENLPPPPDSFLGDKGREMLLLPSRRVHVERQFSQFSRLVSAHPKIAAVWHVAGKEGRELPPSPFWDLYLESARKNGVIISAIAPPPEPPAAAGISPPPPPAARAKKIPEKIYITAAGRLMQCPYHFFAMDILRLNEEDGDDAVNPAALGTLLHRGMKKFAEAAGEECEPEKLLLHWRETFSALPALRPGAKLALQHWLLRGESFIREEEAKRRAEGWMPQFLEQKTEAELMLSGRPVRLSGRLDRADQNGAQWAIVDYKSGAGPNQKEMTAGEAPQLPLYAFLLGKKTAQWRVCYPVKPDKTACVDGSAIRIAARLRAAARKIAAGAVLPAHGAPKTCAGCPSRRLCRRDHWGRGVSEK